MLAEPVGLALQPAAVGKLLAPFATVPREAIVRSSCGRLSGSGRVRTGVAAAAIGSRKVVGDLGIAGSGEG